MKYSRNLKRIQILKYSIKKKLKLIFYSGKQDDLVGYAIQAGLTNDPNWTPKTYCLIERGSCRDSFNLKKQTKDWYQY